MEFRLQEEINLDLSQPSGWDWDNFYVWEQEEFRREEERKFNEAVDDYYFEKYTLKEWECEEVE